MMEDMHFFLVPKLGAEVAAYGTSGGRQMGEPWERKHCGEAVLRGARRVRAHGSQPPTAQ